MSEEILVSTFTAMRNKLRSIAARLMPREEEADDALQEAFCRLWSRRDTINTNKEAEALASTTIRNICIDQHRKRRIETVPINEEHDTQECESDNKEQLLEEVEEIINQQLTALQQEIIERKEYNSETIEEIAKSLGMQEAAVRMQLSRARKKIRECYQKRNQQ